MSNAQLVPTLEKPELSVDGDETVCEIALELDREPRDLPLNIVFCLDVSGSMLSLVPFRTSKLDRAKTGTKQAVTFLGSDDTFAVVGFGSRADALISATSGDRADADAVADDILNIGTRTDTGGGTDITAGLQESRRQLDRMSGSLTRGGESPHRSGSTELDWPHPGVGRPGLGVRRGRRERRGTR